MRAVLIPAFGLVLSANVALAQTPDSMEIELGQAYQKFDQGAQADIAARVHLADALSKLIEARRAEKAAAAVAADRLKWFEDNWSTR